MAAETSPGESANIEYETQCTIVLDPVYADMFRKSVTDRNRYMYVFYYENGTRMSRNLFQKKEPIMRPRRLLYLSGTWDKPFYVPMMRTACKEVTLDSSNLKWLSSSSITSRVERLIIKKENGFRISVDWRCDSKGINPYINGEVEYDEKTMMDYKSLKSIEAQLVCLMKEELFRFTKNMAIVFDILSASRYSDKIEINTLYSTPCRVFNKLKNIKIEDPNEVYIKSKYDGFKGKMVCNKINNIMYIDDAHVCIPNVSSTFLNKLPNLFIQVENMCEVVQKKPSDALYKYLDSLIVTDIIGMKIGGNYYTPEPQDVLTFLQTFKNREHLISMNDKSFKTVFVQRIINESTEKSLAQEPTAVKRRYTRTTVAGVAEHADTTVILPTDGIILVYEDREYKYKVPTFDVKIKNGRAFVKKDANISTVNSNNVQLNDQTFNMPDGIYEVGFSNPTKSQKKLVESLTILRRRIDRINPSTLNEVREAESEFVLIRNFGNKIKKRRL